MRSSKFRALLLMLLLSFTGRVYLQAQPLAQPNWYAPVGYFSELARDLSEAKGEGKSRQDTPRNLFASSSSVNMEMLDADGSAGIVSMAPMLHATIRSPRQALAGEESLFLSPKGVSPWDLGAMH